MDLPVIQPGRPVGAPPVFDKIGIIGLGIYLMVSK